MCVFFEDGGNHTNDDRDDEGGKTNDDGGDVDYYNDSCVPLAKRWSTARFDTSITRIMCSRIGRSLV